MCDVFKSAMNTAPSTRFTVASARNVKADAARTAVIRRDCTSRQTFGKLYSVIRVVRRVIYERRTDARTFLRRRADETLPMSCKASRKDRCLTGLPEGSLTRERLPGTFSQTVVTCPNRPERSCRNCVPTIT